MLWSIGVGGFCFLLLCQDPSQRLLISVNLSCATTFSFPLPLSLSPIFLTFPFSLYISISLLFDLFTFLLIADYLSEKLPPMAPLLPPLVLPWLRLALSTVDLISHTDRAEPSAALCSRDKRQQTGVFSQHFNDNK